MSAETAHDHAYDPHVTFQHAGVVSRVEELVATGGRWAIVTARFNNAITQRLFAGAVDALVEAGARAEHIHAFTVPGAIELPTIARELANTSHYSGIVALGCVIRGETSHFDYVCQGATDGLTRTQLDTGVPIGFGLLTTDNRAQAEARSGSERNAGADAARAAIEVAMLARHIRAM